MKRVRNLMTSRRRGLRKNATPAEVVLWEQLKQGRFMDYKFRRQHSIGWYIADFYCPKARLIIELDGLIHDLEEQKESDLVRTEWLQAQGYVILRFRNEEVLENPSLVATMILDSLL